MGNLIENTYIVQMDNRLGRLADLAGGIISEDYIDDDNIAFYTIDAGTGVVMNNSDDSTSAEQAIAGPRGLFLSFLILLM